MKKTLICLLVLSNLLLAGSVFAVKIENPLTGVNNFTDLLTKIIQAVAVIVGSLSVLMFLIAGILFLISSGSPEKLGRAKDALFYAIIGTVIALAATGIVQLIKKIIGA